MIEPPETNYNEGVFNTPSLKRLRMKKNMILISFYFLCIGVLSCSSSHGKMNLNGVYEKTPKANTAHANPLLDFVYCADPTAIVHEGRVYVYGSNDQQQCDSVGIEVTDNTYEYIHSLVMISSDDMVNWTYHGAINVEEAAPWTGKKGVSWAPSIVSRIEADGRTHFYLYYAHGGGGVAMLTSTSPVGPWADPLGHDIVYFGMPGLEECPAPFDPGVVIDEHGQGWLSFGGGTASYGTDYMPGSARIVRFGDDMMSVVGDIVEIPAPYFFEASELNYINGTYIYSYSTNWVERNEWPYSTIEKPTTCCIGYMTSKTPLVKDSWEYRGNILKNPGEYDGMSWANNHTHFLKFKDNYYMFYHNRILEEARGIKPGFRSICVDKMTLDEANATIELGAMTRRGPAQIKQVNPFQWQSAATTAATYGIKYIKGSEPGKMILQADGNGQFFEVRGVDCTASPKKIEFRVKGKGEIVVRKNGSDGEEIATVRFDANNWQVVSTTLAPTLKDVQDLCFIVEKGEILLDEWKFSN